MDDIKITKAREAMDNLLMAYSAMIDYSFEGAHEMRAAVMELIHSLEHHITTQEPSVEIETSYHDEEYSRDSTQKEIVIEDDIIVNNTIYGAGPYQLLDIVKNQDNLHHSLMLFGHNPTFTTFANMVSNENIFNVVTCGVVRIDFNIQKLKRNMK